MVFSTTFSLTSGTDFFNCSFGSSGFFSIVGFCLAGFISWTSGSDISLSGDSLINSLTGSIFGGTASCFLEIESLIFWKNPFFSGTLSIGFSITSPSSSTFLEKRAMPCFSFSFKNLNIFLGFDECVELLLERNSLGSELVDLVSNLFLEPVNFAQLLSQKSFYACEILVYHNP